MVARVTPVGTRLSHGFATLIAFTADPDVSLWETSVKPPGIEGGEAIDTTTMHNTAWRTKALRVLKELTESTFNAGFDPAVVDQIVALVNVETLITVHFPDDSELDFYGGLRTFEPPELSEEEFPEAACTVTPTNSNGGVETAPNYRGPAS